MTAPKERRLPWLPDYGAGLPEWRDWLTAALTPDGYRIDDFLRHGRQRGDTCELVVLAPGGKRLYFEIEEQRLLMSSASLRAALVGATDGLLRPGALTKSEFEDIWVALCTLATTRANQNEKDETREWLFEAIRAAEPIAGYTMQPPGRLDALLALTSRPLFDRIRAFEHTNPRIPLDQRPCPGLLIDETLECRWMRVGELVVYLRHVIGVPSMNQARLDGRLTAISVTRDSFSAQSRTKSLWVEANLYRLPGDAVIGGFEPS
jgi:hypothetical protein